MHSLLDKLSGLPETKTWVVVERLGRNPDSTLFMGLAVTSADLEELIPLESNLSGVRRFIEKARNTPAVPAIEEADDVFI